MGGKIAFNNFVPKQIIEQTINAPITEIVLTDATVNDTDSKRGIYKLSFETYGFNWGFGSGKSHCGVAKSIIK
jgi:hypothetical protein